MWFESLRVSIAFSSVMSKHCKTIAPIPEAKVEPIVQPPPAAPSPPEPFAPEARPVEEIPLASDGPAPFYPTAEYAITPFPTVKLPVPV